MTPFLRSTIAEPSPAAASFDPSALADRIARVGPVQPASLARPGARVCIAFTDATRACPDSALIPFVLNELESLGVRPCDVTLLCATGLHRPSTQEERLAKLGAPVLERARVVDHDALDPQGLVELGNIDGLPVVANRLCAEADVLIATGVVEPHQYAGYSGGFKTAVIGCGGEATIQATHSAAMLDHPGTRLGAIEGNPFQQFVRRAGARIGLDLALNVVMNAAGQMLAAAYGEPAAVHEHLVEQARQVFEVPVPRPAHLALAGVEPVKAVNLYQASRAATYLALADRSPLLPGAPIVLPAPIPEGAGQGTGERRFFEMLSQADSPAGVLERMRRIVFPAGAQRAYVLAQVLVQHPIIVAGALHPEVARACHMLTAGDVDEALAMAGQMARQRFGVPDGEPLDCLVVPHALLTLPRLAEDFR